MTTPDNTPVLVAAGQCTWHETSADRTPLDALYQASAAAIADANNPRLASAIDTIATVRFIADTNPGTRVLFPRNPGRQLAERLGIAEPQVFQGTIGGNTPQYLVNHFAGQLARGEHKAVLLSGAELLATLFAALRSGDDIAAWAGPAQDEPATLGAEREGLNATEALHGLYEPINTYPLFENSLRHHLGRTDSEHSDYIARLCSQMSKVAATNPHAWRSQFQTADEIATVAQNNRYIGYPYTRAMNPVLAVDMAAAVIMTTVGTARELGIDQQQWIYLHGGTDINDIWHVSQRPQLFRSPAIELAWNTLSGQTGIDLDEVSLFDLYSCFPSAVEIACHAIGLSPLDPRGVTVTGGLPYFGGPGNNYSLHAIAQMVSSLRDIGSGHGLVTANGLYLTKHSMGLYSTEAPQQAWQAIDNSALQKTIDDSTHLRLAADPEGEATIESFTVSFDRDGPKKGIVIASNKAGERIVANTRADKNVLDRMMTQDPIGQSGHIVVEDGINILEL